MQSMQASEAFSDSDSSMANVLREWFSRCVPGLEKPPPPSRQRLTSAGAVATRPARRPSKPQMVVVQTPPEDKGSWWAFALALATLAVISRKLALSSQTNDAFFVFVAIGLLQLWLKHRGEGSLEPAAPRGRGRAASSCALASDAETRTIMEIKGRLRAPPTPVGLTDNDELLDVQLLRFVREHGLSAPKVEKCFRKMLAWKAKTFKDPIFDAIRQSRQERPDDWLSAAQMPDGEWATAYMPIAMHAGFSVLGNPVKIERLGRYDVPALTKHKGGMARLNIFYLGLVEHLAHRLDHMSIQEGKLQQTYEIFDLGGLSLKLVSFSVIKFVQDVLVAFSTHYPSSFRKAVVINAPPFVGSLWGLCAKVLPASVNAKVNILGPDYAQVLRADLTPEALRWVESTSAELAYAPHSAPAPTPAHRHTA